MDSAPLPTGSRPEHRVRRRIYGLGFVDEFGPIYALYTILFVDNGITTAQISTVFLLWSVVAIVFEVPSGALADLVDRRKLVAFAFVLRGIGIAVWLVEPSYAGVIIGALLWSIHSSLASGAWEALIHDELTAADDEAGYPTVMARTHQFSNAGIALGTLVATAGVALGATIEHLGWLTVAIHLVSITLVLRLPDVRWVKHTDAPAATDTRESIDAIGAIDAVGTTSLSSWVSTLRGGLRHARRSPVAMRLIILGALLEGLFVIDEYVPLLAADRGAATGIIPVFVLVVFVGLMIGDEYAARRPGVSARATGVALMAGAALMGVAVTVTPLWPLLLIGVGYATLEVTWIIGDARFQQQLPRRTRATLTSVRAFGSGIVSVAAFALLTVTSIDDTAPIAGLVVMAGALFLAGALATRWIPRSTS